jgi:hypothetical protein
MGGEGHKRKYGEQSTEKCASAALSLVARL